jgi:pyruvoyl-dependent arginine decarboxylase (PvlArgDC)
MPGEDKLDKIRQARGEWDWSDRTTKVLWAKDLVSGSQTEKSDKSRVKDAGYVSPNVMLEYLVAKDIPLFHALGIVSNVKYESNFNPKAIGDNGTSAGLFQHHNTRKDALMNYIGNDLSNWQKQIDYMLTENDTRSYLSQEFESPEQASYWFTKNWERPSNKERKAVERQSFLSTFDGGKYYTGIYNPNNTSASTQTLSTAQTYGVPEGTDLPGFSEQDFKAAVDKEVQKIAETEKKNAESIARQRIEELKKLKEQQAVQGAVANVMGAMAKAVNESGRTLSQVTTDISPLYQTPTISIQGANMPTLQAFSDGGLTGDDPIKETRKQREQRIANELLYKIRSRYVLDPEKPNVVSFGEDVVYKGLDPFPNTPMYSHSGDKYSIAGQQYAPDLETAEDPNIIFDDESKIMITYHDGAPVPIGTGRDADNYLKKYFYDKSGYADFKLKRKALGKDKIIPYFTPQGDENLKSFETFKESLDNRQSYGGLFKYADGGTVSEVWQNKTGLPWSEASKLGFTDGTYEGNVALRKRLLAGDLDVIGSEEKRLTPNQLKNTIDQAPSFKEAFTVARQELGPNRLFEYEGRVYGTNQAGEELNPPQEDIAKFNLDKKYTEKRLKKENDKVSSPYSSKETVKVEPDWEDWEKIKEAQAEQNRMNNADKIVSYKKENPDGKNFAIVDKKKGLLHLYNANGTLRYSAPMDVDTGLNPGDAQTVTKYRDINNDGITNPDEVRGENVDWSAGNKSTGAGIFYISNIDKEGYGGLPILNMMNERQYDEFEKTGQINSVSTSFHKGFINDGDPRASNGCVRCNKPTLDRLVASLENSSQVFILPEDANNEFTVQNNKLVFLPKSDKNYDEYVDQRGEVQSGQGINRSVNTLNYIPILPEVDFDKMQLKSTNKSTKDWGVETNKSAEDQKERVNEFVKALSDNKKQIMKYAKVNGDVYNEIAKMAFGILGSESDYAALYDNVTNTAKGLNRIARGGNVGGTDYKFEYDFRASDKEKGWNSLGMTQLVWNQLEDSELKLLEKLGVNRISQLTEPKKAAVATAALLAHRFNNRSFDRQKLLAKNFPLSAQALTKSSAFQEGLSEDARKDVDKVRITADNMWDLLPTTWNNREGYADRVKANSEPLSIKQLNDSDKIKEIKDGEKEAEAFVNKYVKTRELSPSESIGISNQKQLDIAVKKKRQKQFEQAFPNIGNQSTGTTAFSENLRRYQDGGVYDLTDEEIQKLEEGGYKIEYLD